MNEWKNVKTEEPEDGKTYEVLFLENLELEGYNFLVERIEICLRNENWFQRCDGARMKKWIIAFRELDYPEWLCATLKESRENWRNK